MSISFLDICSSFKVFPYCPCGLQFPNLRIHKDLMIAKTQAEVKLVLDKLNS